MHDAVEHDDANRLVLVALRPETELAEPDKDIIADYLIPYTTQLFNYNKYLRQSDIIIHKYHQHKL